ncbi:MAG: hypothetical protein RR232_03935 [Clostridia bacterium]
MAHNTTPICACTLLIDLAPIGVGIVLLMLYWIGMELRMGKYIVIGRIR